MANKYKNINELVSDEDPTEELEALTVRHALGQEDPNWMLEADADTFDVANPAILDDDGADESLQAELDKRSEIIERLQFDVETLRARQLGLETEIEARESITSKFSSEIEAATQQLARKTKRLKERDRTIKSLKAEIRERNRSFQDLQQANARLDAQYANSKKSERTESVDIDSTAEALAAQAGQLASATADMHELQAQQARTEAYADQLRQQLTDLRAETSNAFAERESFRTALAEKRRQNEQLLADIAAAKTRANESDAALDAAAAEHENEIRLLRFELGQAEETLAEHDHISEQLASDLLDTRNFRDQLERMLDENENQSQARVEDIEKQVRKLKKDLAAAEQKLDTKSSAINCLLAELAKKNETAEDDSDAEIDIQDTGSHAAVDESQVEAFDDSRPADRDRITRLLIGNVDNQELRFPLFKNRLTIGRTEQNDIQLKAQYISRRHAVITTEGDTTRLIDWGSRNGVYVNSRRVTEHFLNSGDIVTIGTAQFRYEERAKRTT